MKYLLFVLLFVACKEEAPKPGKVAGQCLNAEEAVAQGFKACKEPGCLCVKDTHGGKPNDTPHCHSSPANCTIE